MRVIFISGAYRADTKADICRNIKKAREVAIKLWQDGWAVICPHSNTALFDGEADDSVWLKGDLEILSRCDAIYMMANWDKSKGARDELIFAQNEGIEVYFE